MSFNRDLFSEKHISDLFPCSADIGPPAHHELISNYTQGKVIDSITVILAAHDLWSHIPWRSTRIRAIISFQDSCNSHIRDPEIPILLHDYILWFDVPMYHILIVHVF